MSNERKGKSSIMCGVCPDKRCRSKLFFPNFDSSIECTHCGQRHDRSSLQSVQEVSDFDSRLSDMIRNILMSNIIPKRGTETVKVLGLSNYHCKLLSPLLTKYGMDKKTGKARLLTEMNQGDIFDCGLFGDRAFLIDIEHIPVPGFGRDVTGSMSYLSQTLDHIKRVNGNEERLIPIHADGDGHCLVHAVSRALVGRELFWHPLRCSLKKHFEVNLEPYKELFRDFVDEGDWKYIIDECDPDFVPPEGELLGLRNIHVFGLANVLKRPIILLDSLECMNSLGDYAALFLPSLIAPELCRGKDNHLNKPLCIAWSSSGHNHYIPLVGIKKKPLPVLPISLMPKAWGVPQSQIFQYMEFEDGNFCTIGGDRNLGDPYILRLVSSIEELFLEKLGVHPSLVADVHHYLYQSTGVVCADREMVIYSTKKAVDEGRLYRCLNCDAICEQVIKSQWFYPGGVLYNMALLQYGHFVPNQLYPFPLHGIVCRYDGEKNELLPDLGRSSLESCTWCNGSLRKVRANGSVVYKNEDKTKTPSNSTTCGCGFKHYWFGKEYDNPPRKLNVTLEWNNQVLKEVVCWFENETDPSLNSNAYQLASEVVQKHFPGEFGSERLVQRVVEQLLNQTKPNKQSRQDVDAVKEDSVGSMPANKIIMGGTGILHKEELGMSKTERQILQRVQENAEVQQKRHVEEPTQTTSLPVEPEIQQATPPKSSTPNILPSVEMTPNVVPSVEMTPKTENANKYARVVTSDGRQEKLLLDETGLSYGMLKTWIHETFRIAPEAQRIKHGFPPQELHPSDSDEIVRLAHGDRIMVEMISETRHSPSPPSVTDIWAALDRESPFALPGYTMANQCMRILESIRSNNKAEMEELFMSMSASLSNQLVWNYAKKSPHLFKRGGLFYLQVASDIGLRDAKHCNLKIFPNKTFSYNSKSDSLELCAEPYGHFPIHEDIDDRVKMAAKNSKFSSLSCHSQQSAIGNEHGDTVFPGGKTLKGDWETSQESEEKVPFHKHSLIRKGPGYSVLSLPKSSSEMQVGKLQSLASQLTGKSRKISESQSSKPVRSTEGSESKQMKIALTIPANSSAVILAGIFTERAATKPDASGDTLMENADNGAMPPESSATAPCDTTDMDCS